MPFLFYSCANIAPNLVLWMYLSLSEDATSVVQLGFLFDGSGQISDPDFLAQINIAKQIVDSFNKSEMVARVGAATYSPSSRVLFSFNNPPGGQNRTPEAIKQLLDRTPHDQGAARLGQGLQTVDSDLFSPEGGSSDVFSKVRKGIKNLTSDLLICNGKTLCSGITSHLIEKAGFIVYNMFLFVLC